MKLPKYPQGGGQPRRSLWQCDCLRWNPQSANTCGKCRALKPKLPTAHGDLEGYGR